MGLKPSKPREFRRGNIPHSTDIDLPTKPYRFLNDNDLKSFAVPTLVKFHRNRNATRHLELQENAGSTSVAFLRNERYIVFGSICTDLDTYAIEHRLYNEGISEHDSLWLVDLQLAMTEVLVNRPVRDICLSSNGDHLAFLTYSGYSRLHVWPCSDIDRVDNVKIFEEKNLISHSTCCAFSPNGKRLVVAICSDYFTMRSRSHLVVRQVNLSLGKYGKSREIHFAGRHAQNHFPVGLLISLEFSPDSTLLAVGSSQNKLYLLSTKTWELLSVIGEPTDRYTFLSCVFHPLCTHERLVSCTGLGQLEIWEVDVQDSKANTISCDTLDVSDELHTKVSCSPSFAPDGNMLAVGLSNAKVIVVDPNLFCVIWVICPEFIDNDLHMSRTSASSLCFSKSCKYLAIGYSGELVTVWLLPQNSFTLKHFCRTVIISMCPPKMIPKLPIPNSLKQYLLYQS